MITWISLSNQYRLNTIDDRKKTKGTPDRETTQQLTLSDFMEEEWCVVQFQRSATIVVDGGVLASVLVRRMLDVGRHLPIVIIILVFGTIFGKILFDSYLANKTQEK